MSLDLRVCRQPEIQPRHTIARPDSVRGCGEIRCEGHFMSTHHVIHCAVFSSLMFAAAGRHSNESDHSIELKPAR